MTAAAASPGVRRESGVWVIGEPVPVQFDSEEAPFAITVLNLPEVVEDSVRIPVRFTAITSLLTYISITAHLGSGDSDGPHVHSPDYSCGIESFDGVVLVKGGSHEGHLCFSGGGTLMANLMASDPPRVRLHFLDGTEETVFVELTKGVRIPERVRFRDGFLGTLWGFPPVGGVPEPLDQSFDNWGEPPPLRGVGDPVTVNSSAGDPAYELTVLGRPEAVNDDLMRVSARVTWLAESEPFEGSLNLALSTPPDAYGRIHHLWESTTRYGEGLESPDSLTDVVLHEGDSQDGYVYFRNFLDESVLPSAPFCYLWYWQDGVVPFPVDVRSAN